MLLEFRGNVTLRYISQSKAAKLLTRELGELSKQNVGPAFHNEPHILAHFPPLWVVDDLPERGVSGKGGQTGADHFASSA